MTQATLLLRLKACYLSPSYHLLRTRLKNWSQRRNNFKVRPSLRLLTKKKGWIPFLKKPLRCHQLRYRLLKTIRILKDHWRLNSLTSNLLYKQMKIRRKMATMMISWNVNIKHMLKRWAMINSCISFIARKRPGNVTRKFLQTTLNLTAKTCWLNIKWRRNKVS